MSTGQLGSGVDGVEGELGETETYEHEAVQRTVPREAAYNPELPSPPDDADRGMEQEAT